MAAARAGLVVDLWGRGELQVNCMAVGVILVRNDVNKIGLDCFCLDFQYRDQVGFVLVYKNQRKEENEVELTKHKVNNTNSQHC